MNPAKNVSHRNCHYENSTQLFHLIRRTYFLFSVLLLFSSCELKKERLIVLPELLLTFYNESDSIQEIGPEKYLFQIITVIQGECPPCILELQEWQKLIVEFSEFPVEFIFIVHATLQYNFDEITKKIDFDYPVIHDPGNSFMELNFPENPQQYPTFLCRDFVVLATGNPVRDPKVRSRYISLMKDNTL